jgi:hypothetical protein
MALLRGPEATAPTLRVTMAPPAPESAKAG